MAATKSPVDGPSRVLVSVRYVRADQLALICVHEARLGTSVLARNCADTSDATSSIAATAAGGGSCSEHRLLAVNYGAGGTLPEVCVRVSVEPDPTPERSRHFKGDPHPPSFTPAWGTWFKVPLSLPSDSARRLIIRLWDRRADGSFGGAETLLGGFSFGPLEFLKPTPAGAAAEAEAAAAEAPSPPPNPNSISAAACCCCCWYALLEEDIAITSNLRLGTSTTTTATASSRAAEVIPAAHPLLITALAASAAATLDLTAAPACASVTAAPPEADEQILSSSPPSPWSVGDECMAIFAEDQLAYDAVIVSVDIDADTAVVTFVDYADDEKQVTPLGDLIPYADEAQDEEGKATPAKLLLKKTVPATKLLASPPPSPPTSSISVPTIEPVATTTPGVAVPVLVDAIAGIALNGVTAAEQERRACIMSLVVLVRKYAAALARCHTDFVEPLTYDLTGSDLDNIFCNLEEIAALTAELVARLDAALAAATWAVGDAMKWWVGKTAAYKVYMANKQNAIITIKRHMREEGGDLATLVHAHHLANGIGENYVSGTNQGGDGASMDLNGYLSLPSQHLANVQAAITTLLGATPTPHVDTLPLTCARLRLSQVRLEAEAAVDQYGDLTRMKYYEDRILGLPPGFKLSVPGRAFVREGHALVGNARRTLLRRSRNPSLRNLFLLLFSDTILLVERQEAPGGVGGATAATYRLAEPPLSLSSMSMEDTAEADLHIAAGPHAFVLRFRQYREKSMWRELILRTASVATGGGGGGGAVAGAVTNEAARAEPYTLPEEYVLTCDPIYGVGLELRHDQLGFVRTVREGGAAYVAGITTLHRVLAVDSITVDGLSTAGLTELLNGTTTHADAAAGIVTQRSVRLRVVKALRRTTLLRTPEEPSLGLALRGVNPAFVREIVPGAAAERAGIRLGDQLWAVGDTSVRDVDAATVEQILAEAAAKAPHVNLLVRSTLRRVLVPYTARGYGFSLMRTGGEHVPARVQGIRPEGPAALSGLVLGDEVWRMGGEKVKYASLSALRAHIHAAQGERADLDLVVVSTLRTIDLVQQKGARLGFSLSGSSPVLISAVDVGGQADRAGLRRGDAIWAVNDVQTISASHAKVVDLLLRHSGRVRLSVSLSAA